MATFPLHLSATFYTIGYPFKCASVSEHFLICSFGTFTTFRFVPPRAKEAGVFVHRLLLLTGQRFLLGTLNPWHFCTAQTENSLVTRESFWIQFLTHMLVGSMQFLVAIELRASVLSWLLARGHP